MSFHIGQKVVCIKDSTGRINDQGLPGFKRGDILTVAEIAQLRGYPGFFLGFEERDPNNLGHEKGFRPITERKTDISIFKRILADCDQRVDAPCDVEA